MGISAVALSSVAVGTGLSAYSAYEEGEQAAEEGKIAGQQFEAEAQATTETGRYESREKRKEAERFKALQIAQISGQGGKLTGSSLELLANTAANFESDARMIMRNYQLNATNLRMQGAMARWQGQVARSAGRIRAVATVLEKAGSAYFMSKTGWGSNRWIFYDRMIGK
jgi:hypothetical protein